LDGFIVREVINFLICSLLLCVRLLAVHKSDIEADVLDELDGPLICSLNVPVFNDL
jgi:hypothetical protein